MNKIVSYLIQEGFADSYSSGIAIYHAMSDEWLKEAMRDLRTQPIRVVNSGNYRFIRPSDITDGRTEEELAAASERRKKRGKLPEFEVR